MKAIKILCAAALMAATAAVSGAQNMYDAINISRNEYYGTARTMALGNAVTAIGGDVGSFGINPAGSAVANYNQLVITPGISVSVVGASYSPSGESGFGPEYGYDRTRMTLPNFGATAVLYTGRSRGLKSFTFGLISNQTAQYNYYADAYGQTSLSSKAAEFAAAAAGLDESMLVGNSAYDNGVSWDIISAYQSGMFGSYGKGSNYVGVTETIDESGAWHYVPGPLAQHSAVQKWGSKNDVIVNFGMNFSDKVFFGINVGFPYATYGYSESFYESSVNPEQFPIIYNLDDGSQAETYFLSSSFSNRYIADMSGIYAKIGVIVTPFEGLRLGAAIQTPAMYTITEHWQYSATTSFADDYFSGYADSPEGEYSYNLMTPYSANFGVAWTFGDRAFVSVDYELTDYSVMRYHELHPGGAPMNDIFFDVNETNRHFAGVAHNLRIGAELRLTPGFSLRAGYGVATSPVRHWTNNMGDDVTADDFLAEYEDYYLSGLKYLVDSRYYGDMTRSLSFGVGFSSRGSFFADLGAVLTSYPDSVFMPYYDYDNFDAEGNQVNAASPRILNRSKLWNVALTIGWRF